MYYCYNGGSPHVPNISRIEVLPSEQEFFGLSVQAQKAFVKETKTSETSSDVAS